MFEREIKINLKSFVIWSVVLLGIFLVAYLMYPSIINSDSIKMMDEMMQMFPKEIIKAFNMDISSMDSAFGWLKSEGFVMALLVIGCYSGILGSNILLKEENDKTIEYLNSLPIKRNDIVVNKVLAGLIYIIFMVFIFGIFNYIGLSLSGEFNKRQFVLLSITPLFSSSVIYFICLFLSTFAKRNKKLFGVSLGLVLISYMLYTFSTMSDSVEFLKYFSIFTLADVRNVIVNISINPVMIVISIILSIVFFILTIINYNKKELV